MFFYKRLLFRILASFYPDNSFVFLYECEECKKQTMRHALEHPVICWSSGCRQNMRAIKWAKHEPENRRAKYKPHLFRPL